MPLRGSLPGHPLIELNLVAVLIEVFIEEDLLLRIDPLGWCARRMDGGWLMGFVDGVQDAVDGGGLGDEADDAPRRPTDLPPTRDKPLILLG